MDITDLGSTDFNIQKFVTTNNSEKTEWRKSSPLKTYSKKLTPPSNEKIDGKSRYGRAHKPRLSGDYLSTDKKVSQYLKVDVDNQMHYFKASPYAVQKPVPKSPATPGTPRRGRPPKAATAKPPDRIQMALHDTLNRVNSFNMADNLIDIEAPIPTSTETVEIPAQLIVPKDEPQDEAEEPIIEGDWNIGDLAWACVGGFPYWPCAITKDPIENQFKKIKYIGKNRHPKEFVHVRFFGDKGRRSWIKVSNMIPFYGLSNFQALAEETLNPGDSNERDKETNIGHRKSDRKKIKRKKDPKQIQLQRSFTIPLSIRKTWQAAVSEAESLNHSPRPDRVLYFMSMFPHAHEQTTELSAIKPEPKKRGRKRKTELSATPPSDVKKIKLEQEDPSTDKSEDTTTSSQPSTSNSTTGFIPSHLPYEYSMPSTSFSPPAPSTFYSPPEPSYPNQDQPAVTGPDGQVVRIKEEPQTPKKEIKKEPITPQASPAVPLITKIKKELVTPSPSSVKVPGKKGRPLGKRKKSDDFDFTPLKRKYVKKSPLDQRLKENRMKKKENETKKVLLNNKDKRFKDPAYEMFYDKHFDRVSAENPTLSTDDIEKFIEKMWLEVKDQKPVFRSREGAEMASNDSGHESKSESSSRSASPPIIPPSSKTPFKRGISLFAGARSDKVCQVCFKSSDEGEIFKCRGPCMQPFHVFCADKPRYQAVEFKKEQPTEEQPPTEKRKRGRPRLTPIVPLQIDQPAPTVPVQDHQPDCVESRTDLEKVQNTPVIGQSINSLMSPDGTPMKRKRGRPRKYPLVPSPTKPFETASSSSPSKPNVTSSHDSLQTEINSFQRESLPSRLASDDNDDGPFPGFTTIVPKEQYEKLLSLKRMLLKEGIILGIHDIDIEPVKPDANKAEESNTVSETDDINQNSKEMDDSTNNNKTGPVVPKVSVINSDNTDNDSNSMEFSSIDLANVNSIILGDSTFEKAETTVDHENQQVTCRDEDRLNPSTSASVLDEEGPNESSMSIQAIETNKTADNEPDLFVDTASGSEMAPPSKLHDSFILGDVDDKNNADIGESILNETANKTETIRSIFDSTEDESLVTGKSYNDEGLGESLRNDTNKDTAETNQSIEEEVQRGEVSSSYMEQVNSSWAATQKEITEPKDGDNIEKERDDSCSSSVDNNSIGNTRKSNLKLLGTLRGDSFESETSNNNLVVDDSSTDDRLMIEESSPENQSSIDCSETKSAVLSILNEDSQTSDKITKEADNSRRRTISLDMPDLDFSESEDNVISHSSTSDNPIKNENSDVPEQNRIEESSLNTSNNSVLVNVRDQINLAENVLDKTLDESNKISHDLPQEQEIAIMPEGTLHTSQDSLNPSSEEIKCETTCDTTTGEMSSLDNVITNDDLSSANLITPLQTNNSQEEVSSSILAIPPVQGEFNQTESEEPVNIFPSQAEDNSEEAVPVNITSLQTDNKTDEINNPNINSSQPIVEPSSTENDDLFLEVKKEEKEVKKFPKASRHKSVDSSSTDSKTNIVKEENGTSQNGKNNGANNEGAKCGLCIENKSGPCFVCGKEGEERIRCGYCGKVYHLECAQEWPQSQITERTTKGLLFYCPQHVCHNCVSDNPSAVQARFNRDRLVRCMMCPATYHYGNYCVPAGSEILSTTQIICPRHYVPLKKGIHHVNASWCFLCSVGGSLICCDLCPNSFHAECLKISPPEGSFICEDCETGRYPLYGEIVWVKLGTYRWWPAKILYPQEVPDNIKLLPHTTGEFAVEFFGSHDYYWVNRGRVFLYHEGDGCKNVSKSRVDELFAKGVQEASAEFLKWCEERAKREATSRPSMKPPKYVKIQSNRLVGNVAKTIITKENVAQTCECDPTKPEPCGPDSDCINRLLSVECDPEVCPAGGNCCNQNFEKKNYPRLVPFKTETRGWGLKTKDFIKKGAFIIEYVGEMIDEEEYQRRLTNMQKNKDENFYFLTLDKDRMLDAGPKGNVARFMNHSCDPNCETQKWTVNGDTRVGLFALVDIQPETELVFNYNLATIGDTKVECKCGAANCAGFIGAKNNSKQPKTPAGDDKKAAQKKKKRKQSKSKHTEDTCFTCGNGGELLLCDDAACPKAYHLSCLGLTKHPAGGWVCPWHQCSVCSATKVQRCTLCINSYCAEHAEGNISLNKNHGLLCFSHNPSDSGSDWSDDRGALSDDDESVKAKSTAKKNSRSLKVMNGHVD